MNIAVTGANGFIGQYVVKQLSDAGHAVRALYRTVAPSDWKNTDNIKALRCDLLDADEFTKAIDGCDAVIHLAAVMQGGRQYDDTLKMTQHLLDAADSTGVNKLLLLSSISVLDYVRVPTLDTIDENTAINTNDDELGDYARMKRDQEKLCRAWSSNNKSLLVLRPGLVYDQNQLSNAHAGFKNLVASHTGQVPLVHAELVAQACVSLTQQDISNDTFHILDLSLPSQQQYLAMLKQRRKLGTTISLPWAIYSLVTSLLRFVFNQLKRKPDGLRLNSVSARQKPFMFSGRKWVEATSENN